MIKRFIYYVTFHFDGSELNNEPSENIESMDNEQDNLLASLTGQS